ncbi:MAG: hypothetical protein JRF33_21210, partial [Deltaproteobacteria bacterium]|nr:hypothetical protein [Deltaproteobacteria bacterium]
QGAAWAGRFEITATPPPSISSITPLRAAGNDFTGGVVTLTVQGGHFIDGAVITLIDEWGAATDIPTTFVSEAELNGSGSGMAFGNQPYAVRVTNPDEQWDVYYVFSLTSSADGKLTAWDDDNPESNLLTPRYKHAATHGFDIFGSGYVYVAGGYDASDTPLDSVEYMQVSVFGNPGVWRESLQWNGTTHVPNTLTIPRTAASMVGIGPYLYVVGGSQDGISGERGLEVARILGITTVPYLSRRPAPAEGSLPVGSWYYRVSAVMASGEGLPSAEAVALDQGGGLTIRWARVEGAESYNIYRSLASDGRSQTSRLLTTGVVETSFTDDGMGALAPAPGNLRGRGAASVGSLDEGLWSYRVSAVTASGETLAGYLLTAEVAVGEDAMELNWDEVADATSYKVYRSLATGNGADQPLTYLLTEGLNQTGFIDDGSLAPDENQVAPDGILPLPPGSLTRWAQVVDADGQAVLMNEARMGLRAVIVSLTDLSDEENPERHTFLYAAGGETAVGGTVLSDIERAEILLLNGTMDAFVDAGADFSVARSYYALMSSQGRSENPMPGDDPPQPCGDVDGDGFADYTCGGTDCDDSDPTIYPGADEVCGDGIDQDCDGEDLPCGCTTDADNDGYISEFDCGGTDCDDTDPNVNPGADEICGDGIDQDCDGIDPDCECVTDADGDGYISVECEGGTDCDDSDASVHPGAEDICEDGIDQNCDGIDPSCICNTDADGDGYISTDCPGGTDCDDTDPTVHPGAYDWCGDGIDQDCNGWDPTCRGGSGTRASDPAIFLVATKGMSTNDGTQTTDVCTISDEAGTFGDLNTWTINADRPSDFWGHEGLLYFDYVFNFAGTSQASNRAKSQTERYDFIPAATDPALVVDNYQSSAATVTFARAYFSITRIFSSLIAIGGLDEDEVLGNIETIRQ